MNIGMYIILCKNKDLKTLKHLMMQLCFTVNIALFNMHQLPQTEEMNYITMASQCINSSSCSSLFGTSWYYRHSFNSLNIWKHVYSGEAYCCNKKKVPLTLWNEFYFKIMIFTCAFITVHL